MSDKTALPSNLAADATVSADHLPTELVPALTTVASPGGRATLSVVVVLWAARALTGQVGAAGVGAGGWG